MKGLGNFKKDKIFKGLTTSFGFALIFVMMISPSNFGLPTFANADNSEVAGKTGSLNMISSPGAGSLTVQSSNGQTISPQGQVTLSQLPAAASQAATNASPKVLPYLSGPSNVAPQTSSKITPKVVSVNIQDQVSSAPTAPLVANPLGGFEGIDYPADCFCTPPDGNAAAGPNDIIQMVNLDAKVWSKSGVARTGNIPMKNFFLTGTDFISDPRVVYDPQSGRWFATILGIPSTGNGYVAVAASSGTDPAAGWCVYHIGASDIIPDQPRLAVSDDKVTFVTSNYHSGSGPFTGEQVFWLPKAPMLTCSGFGYQWFGPDTSRFHIEPAVRTVAGSPDLWYVQDGAGGATGAEYLHESGPVGSISFVSAFVTPIFATSNPPGAPQKGTATLVATNDARISSASISGTTITWVANDGCGVSCVRWDVADTTGTLHQDLDFNAGKYAYFPAVSQDDSAGEFGVIFQYSSSNDFPSIGFTGQSRTESFGIVDNPVVVKAGTGTDTSGRHGDYDSIRYDGSTVGHFYAEAEYNAAGSPWNTFLSVGSISSGTLPSPDATTLTLNPIPNTPWGVSFGVSGKLTDSVTGLGLGGMPITFTATGGNVLSTVTNPDGTYSSVGGAPSGTPPVSVTVTAKFAGTTSFSPSSAIRGYNTIKHTPIIETLLFTAVPWNHLQYFSAEALDASTGGVLAGKTITWTGSAVPLPTNAITDSFGFAEATKTATSSLGTVNATASFAGDSFYFPATGNTATYLSFRHFVGIVLWTPANVTTGAPTTFGATLVDTAYNTKAIPIPGVTITFNGTGVSGGTLTGTTNANGDVIVHGVAPGSAGTWTVQANFAGNAQYQQIHSVVKSYKTS